LKQINLYVLRTTSRAVLFNSASVRHLHNCQGSCSASFLSLTLNEATGLGSVSVAFSAKED